MRMVPDNPRRSSASPALRLRLEQALARADPRPPGMAPEAVLLVRRFSAPAPDGSSAWGRALSARLAEFARGAARPARGDAGRDAPAVLFADPAELLACLAYDLATGAAAGCWWWHAYLRGQPATPARLPAVLGADLRVLPAALAQLAAARRAQPVLAALTPAAARELAVAVTRCFGAGDVRALLDRPHVHSGAATSPAALSSRRPPHAVIERAPTPAPLSLPATAAQDAGSAALPAPWAELLPTGALSAALAREHALLLGMALTLHQYPARVRAPAFQSKLAAWWVSADPGPWTQERDWPPEQSQAQPPMPLPAGRDRLPTSVRLGTDEPAASRSGLRIVRRRSGNVPAAGADAASRVPVERVIPAAPEHVAPPAQPVPEPDGRLQSSATSALEQPPASPARPPWASVSGSLDPGAAEPGAIVEAPDAVETLHGPALDGGVATDLGGVLYLINLMLYLDLPECFEPGWRLLSDVGPWRVLALLAGGLIDHSSAWKDDPVWDVLASLAGPAPRRAAPPRPLSYRIPAPWLAQLPDDPDEQFFFAAGRRWLRLWSSRGFVVYDGPTRRAGAAAVSAMLVSLGIHAARLTAADMAAAPLAVLARPPIEAPARLRRWLGCALPYVRLRLALALGLQDAPGVLERALLLRRGWLYSSATHVDLVLGLSGVTLPVRLAGLDRSPGWIPEYGRAIMIHFEEDTDGRVVDS